MKKNLILILTTFLIFSCSLENEKKEVLEKTNFPEVKNEIVKNENNSEKCLEKSPIEKGYRIIYWTFKNKNDNLCYYLGFFYNNFFLVDENLKEKDFSINKTNLLYGEKTDILAKQIHEKYKFQEVPSFILFDEKNIFDLYLEKFQELNIILPEKDFIMYKENFDNEEDFIFWLKYRSEETKVINEKNYIPVKKYLLDLNLENFYEILYKKQKELEKN